MKGTLVEDNGEFYNEFIPLVYVFIEQFLFIFLDNESTSDDSIMSNDKTQGKYSNTRDRSQNKGYLSRVHSSHHNSSRLEYYNLPQYRIYLHI